MWIKMGFFLLLSGKRKQVGHFCYSQWRSCPDGWFVGKTKSVAYGSHYLPVWLKARVCPPAIIPGLRPSHQPQLFLLLPVYYLIMCALLTIVVRPVCLWWVEGTMSPNEPEQESKSSKDFFLFCPLLISPSISLIPFQKIFLIVITLDS